MPWKEVILAFTYCVIFIFISFQCTKTCDGIRIRGLVCQLGEKIVDDNKCSLNRPSIVEKCNENVPCVSCRPKSFCTSLLPFVSNKGVMDICKRHCCDLCDSQ